MREGQGTGLPHSGAGEEHKTGSDPSATIGDSRAKRGRSRPVSLPEHLVQRFREAASEPGGTDTSRVARRYEELKAALEIIRQGPIATNSTIVSKDVCGPFIGLNKEPSRAQSDRPPRRREVSEDKLSHHRQLPVPPAKSGDRPGRISHELGRRRPAAVPMRDAQNRGGLLPSWDRGMEFAHTVTESIDVLTGIWACDAHANGQYRLLDFPFMPTALPNAARYWSTATTAEGLDRCAGRRIGMSDVAAVWAAVEVFRRLDDRFGGGRARITAVRYLHGEVTPLLKGSYSDRVGRRLFGAIADLTQLVGWMAYDVGEHGLGQRYFAQALRLARASGDHVFGGFILSRMSRQATYLDHPQAAVELGVVGREGAAGHATPTAMALFYSVEARGYGLLGDVRACTAALARAEQYLDAAKPGDEPAWSRFFDEAQLSDEFAHCFRDLGKPREALRFAERSLRLRRDSYARSKAFCHTVLATAYLQQGELEEACRTGRELIREVTRLQSVRGWEYIRDFRRRLAPYQRERAVREFDTWANARTVLRQ